MAASRVVLLQVIRSMPMRVLGLLVVLCSAPVPAADGPALTRSTIDGGGAMFSSGGAFSLGGTIGQPDAGAATGGSFALSGGFWSAAPAVAPPTPTGTATSTSTRTATRTGTPTATGMATNTATRTATRSATPSVTGTGTQPATPTASRSATATATTSASATPSPSATGSQPPSPSHTPTPAGTESPTPSATPLVCVGDCNGDRLVTIDELVRGVNIALGNLPVDECPASDRNGDRRVTVEELIAAVNNTLLGCAGELTSLRSPRFAGASVTGSGCATNSWVLTLPRHRQQSGSETPELFPAVAQEATA